MSNQVQTQEKMSSFLALPSTQTYLEGVLGSKKDSFVTNIASLMAQNQALAQCTSVSIFGGAIIATSLNLSLNKSFGYSYLVPYNNSKTGQKEAQFQIGYKGYIQLAMRTGEYKRLNAATIYENQFVSWNEMEEELKLNSVEGDGKVVGYAAYFKLMNGFEKTMFWTYDHIMTHADTYSDAFSAKSYDLLLNGKIPEKDLWKYSSFWYKDFNGMALKTMLRQLLGKYGLLSDSMQKAYEYDQSVVIDNKPIYVDNSGGGARKIKAETIDQPDVFTEVSIDDVN